VLMKSNMDAKIGAENICSNIHEALGRASEFLSKSSLKQ